MNISSKLKMHGKYILSEDGVAIAQLEYCHDIPVLEANGRRIVACWNACDGVSNEDLEIGTFDLSKSYKEVCEERDYYKKELDSLRDALTVIAEKISLGRNDTPQCESCSDSGIVGHSTLCPCQQRRET